MNEETNQFTCFMFVFGLSSIYEVTKAIIANIKP